MNEIRHNWTAQEIIDIYNRPLMDLLYEAATVHRQYHDPNTVQVSTLLSVKTGGCSEDCCYCSQSARYHTEVEIEPMMSLSQVKAQALRAKASGSSRVCMGAAWRNVKDGPEFEQVLEMVRTINKLDMEVCCTLGMLTENQAKRLSEAGLYAYNHNLDTSEDYYSEIVTTRSYEDRLKTIENVRKTSITICSGGIIDARSPLHPRSTTRVCTYQCLSTYRGYSFGGTPSCGYLGNGTHDRYRTHCDATITSTPLGRTHEYVPRRTGLVLLCWGKLHLCWRQASDNAQP